MKAVSYEGTRKMLVSDHPKPKLESPTDALLRVTTSGICGSDLRMYDGRTPLDKGTVVGHEIMGVIEDVGEAYRVLRMVIVLSCRSTSRAESRVDSTMV